MSVSWQFALAAKNLADHRDLVRVAVHALPWVEQPVVAVTRDDVKVKVKLRLIGRGSVVVQQVQATGRKPVANDVCNTSRSLHHVGGDLVVKVPDVDDVLLRDDQAVARIHR